MSKPWDIVPNVGIGPVRFGMTRQEVRAALNTEFRELKRTPSSEPADEFKSLGAFAYYSNAGHLEAIEVARPQQVTVAGLNLSISSTEQLLHEIRLVDPRADIEQKSSGFVSRVLGTSIWTEGERSEPPQSVIAFIDGYFD